VRLLAITHQRDSGPGVFAEAISARAAQMDEWFIAETDEPPGDPFGYDAVLTFGAAANPDQEHAFPWMQPEKELLAELLHRNTPLFGSCFGAQLLGEAAGSPSRRASEPEIGWYDVELTDEGRADPVLGGLPPTFSAFQWHSYEVPLPPGATELACSPVCLQAYRIGARAWGVQFHVEVSAEDAGHWIDEYEVDADAVAMGFDPAAKRAETTPKMPAWNEMGRQVCWRFLDVVAARAATR